MGKHLQFGKKSITELKDNKLVETAQSFVAGNAIFPRKIHTEESVEVRSRAEQDAEYIKFADEEDRLQKTGRLIEAEFQIHRTPAATKRGARYAVKKLTILDSSMDNGV